MAGYCVVLFESISHAVKAEKIVQKAHIACKLIPVPRHLSSDCGICLRIPAEKRVEIDELLRQSLRGYVIAEL